MPRKPLGDRPMSNAERQARHRAVRAAALPVIHYRRAVDHRSRARRWHDAVAVLLTLQAEYRAWLQALPDSLQEGATAEALQIIVDLDLDELQAIEPPRGFVAHVLGDKAVELGDHFGDGAVIRGDDLAQILGIKPRRQCG